MRNERKEGTKEDKNKTQNQHSHIQNMFFCIL